MGSDAMAVVDAEMRVYGIDAPSRCGRVGDADIVSGNLNAPTQMIAERAADWILGIPAASPASTFPL